MKALKNRIDLLERQNSPEKLPSLDIELISCKEESTNPALFIKVLESEEVAESGLTTRTYHYERKQPNKT